MNEVMLLYSKLYSTDLHFSQCRIYHMARRVTPNYLNNNFSKLLKVDSNLFDSLKDMWLSALFKFYCFESCSKNFLWLGLKIIQSCQICVF